MTWIAIGLVLALATGLFGLPYAVLFRPWRVKRLAYFLMARSTWYDRWVWRLLMRRMIRSTRQFTALVPAAKRASDAFARFGEAYKAAMCR